MDKVQENHIEAGNHFSNPRACFSIQLGSITRDTLAEQQPINFKLANIN